MRYNLLCLFLILAVFFGNTMSVAVVDLTEETYEDVKKQPYAFVMLYAPWCGYCTQFKPIFEEAAKKTDKFYFGRVDCTVETKLCQKLRVNYYPTLTFFKNGHGVNFDGDRTADGVIAFMEKYSKFAGLVLNTKEEIEEFRKNNTYHVIAYIQSEESGAYKHLVGVYDRRTLKDTPVALVRDPSLFDGRQEGTIDVFNSQTYAPIHVAADAVVGHDSISKLLNNIFQNTFPLVIQIDDKNYARYRQNRKNVYLSWIDLSDSNRDATIKVLEDVARQFPQFAFGYVDFNEKKERLYKLGAVRQQVNTIIRIDFFSEESFIFEHPREFTVEGISSWIKGIISGEIKANILSELIPETNDGPVYKVVGLTFDEVVLDPTKDVFIQFYIDWCDGCKYLETFDKVGEALKGINDVVVAKIDYNINDIPNIGLEIYGNPTIAVYPRNNKKNPISYSGSQTSDDLLSFFKNHTLSEKARAVPDLPAEEPPRYEEFDNAHVMDMDGNGEVIIKKKDVKHDEL